MSKSSTNEFTTNVVWTGNTGRGTAGYGGYLRSWDIRVPGKPIVHCSNDPALGGDPSLMNPEDLLLSALCACHMLWYLHLAARGGIVVVGYRDEPLATGATEPNGAGRFVRALLRPHVTVRAGTDLTIAEALHSQVHQYCYIARSVSFPIEVRPSFAVD